MHETFTSLVWITGAAAVAPLAAGLLRRLRIPEVVLLLGLGIALGPFGLGLAHQDEPVALLAELGLGFLFFMAGLEVDPASLTGPAGRRAVLAWSASLVLALAWVGVLTRLGTVTAWVAVAIALTSTALGTLLPILRDGGLLEQPLGRLVMANGAVGELGPILAISLLLGSDGAWEGLISLAGFAVLAGLLGGALVVWRRHGRVVPALVARGAETTAQAPVRLVVLLLVLLLALAGRSGLDVVLGAFVAGGIVRLLLPPDHERLLARLDGIAFGFFVPVFFVVSGMGTDIGAVVRRPVLLVLTFLTIVLVRGVPVWLAYRRSLPGRQPLQLALFSATGLPIIVAVTTLAVGQGTLTAEGQSVVVAAGMLTVLVLPLLATLVDRAEPGADVRVPAQGKAGPAIAEPAADTL